MKNFIYIMVATLLLSNCGSKKSLETTIPFTLGEVYAQKWTVDDKPEMKGYEVAVPILSLSEDEAVLKNLYHRGKMAPLEIKLEEIGTVAIAEFGTISRARDTISSKGERSIFPFELTETQAVISYVHKKKVKYYMINGIRQNLTVSYPTTVARNER